jgi:hypothetical protein
MEKQRLTQFAPATVVTIFIMWASGAADCRSKEWSELACGVATSPKLLKKFISSGMFVSIITAEGVDTEDHAMHNPSKQAGWVTRVRRDVQV